MIELNKEGLWKKENTVVITFRLQKSTDSDIIEYLERHGKQPEIKRLIRQAIAAEKAENE